MVLEEASSGTMPDESIGSGQTPVQAGVVNYTLDLEKLPRPYTLFPANIEGMTMAKNYKDIHLYLLNTANFLRRPLTQDEAQAVGEHLSRKNATTMNGMQLGFYWGAWRAWSTRRNFNWPVIDPYKKYPDFNPRKFLVFEGQQAIIARHVARAGIWVVWGMTVGHFLSDAYSSIRGVRNIIQDDRLQAVTKQRTEEARRRQAQAQTTSANDSSPPTTPTPTVKMARDDMSPTGESFSDSSTSTSDSYGRETQAPLRQADQWSTTRSTADMSDDDASPTGGLGLWDEGNDSASGGSAWDRLRQQSASTAPKRSTSQTTSSEDDWISQEASSQQPQQKGGAWDRIRQQNQQDTPQQQQKNDEDSWWK